MGLDETVCDYALMYIWEIYLGKSVEFVFHLNITIKVETFIQLSKVHRFEEVFWYIAFLSNKIFVFLALCFECRKIA